MPWLINILSMTAQYSGGVDNMTNVSRFMGDRVNYGAIEVYVPQFQSRKVSLLLLFES